MLSARNSGGFPGFQAVGGDPNVGFFFQTKGTGSFVYYVDSSPCALYADGGTTDVDWDFQTKGAGQVKANGNIMANRVASAPASSAASGKLGQYFADSTYRYDCINTNTWVRSAVTSSF